MEIFIKNFGPVKNIACDFAKESVILYGSNNTGKSYTVRLIYLLLKTFLGIDYASFAPIIRSHIEEQSWLPLLEDAWEKKEIKISWEINEIITRIYHQLLAGKLEEAFVNAFGSLANLQPIKSAERCTVHIKLDEIMISFSIGEKVQVEICLLDKQILCRLSEDGRAYQVNKDNYTLNLNIEEELTKFDELLAKFLEDIFRSNFESIKREIQGIYFLPDGRAGLYAAYRAFCPATGVTGAAGAAGAAGQTAEPITGYLLNLSRMNTMTTANHPLAGIAAEIEKEILQGTIDVDSTKNGLVFRPQGYDNVLELTAISSSLAAVAILAAFIKLIAAAFNNESETAARRPGLGEPELPRRAVLFIEEPETHIHPDILPALAEVLLKLPAAGVKPVITTHSEFLVQQWKAANSVTADGHDRFTILAIERTAEGGINQVAASGNNTGKKKKK